MIQEADRSSEIATIESTDDVPSNASNTTTLLNTVRNTLSCSTEILKRVLLILTLFSAIHGAFWGLEMLYYHYCVRNFWTSILFVHSTPCDILRTFSTMAKNANASILALLVSLVFGIARLRAAEPPR